MTSQNLPQSCTHSFARFLPAKVVTNNDLSKLMDTSDEWITQRAGIKERRWVEAPMSTSDLGVEAARHSLKLCGDKKVDAIIAATLSPDYNFPGIGVQIQHKLGLDHVPAFDLRNQCSGFLYGLEMADALIRSGTYSRILLVGAEVHSTGLDVSTRGRDIAVLFGDGAGSCIVEAQTNDSVQKQDSFTIIGSELHSDGEYVQELWCENVGSAHWPVRVDAEMVAEGRIFPYMNGRKVFEHAVKRMAEVSVSLLTKHGLTPDDVTYVVPHQANLRINQMVGKHLGVPTERVWNTIEKYGNTTAATIPIGMSHLVEEQELPKDSLILSCAFGSGFTWGAALLRKC